MTKSQKIQFKAEVAKVLDIVIHSLYSNKEIFLRELISNASDACDKLRYEQMLHPELVRKEPFRIIIEPNKTTKTLSVIDNGIGMDKDDAVLAFSRHATSKIYNDDDLFNNKDLVVLASSKEAGATVIKSSDNKKLWVPTLGFK